MSACGSPLSPNTRIEPAVAMKPSVRPDSSTVCGVVESDGRRCSMDHGGLGMPALRASGPLAFAVASGRDGLESQGFGAGRAPDDRPSWSELHSRSFIAVKWVAEARYFSDE